MDLDQVLLSLGPLEVRLGGLLVALALVGFLAAVAVLVGPARSGIDTSVGGPRAAARPGRDRPGRRLGERLEILTAVGAGATGYVVAELTLDAYPPLSHWGIAVALGVLGYGSGWAWRIWQHRSP